MTPSIYGEIVLRTWTSSWNTWILHNIDFTMETGKWGKLPFLSILVQKKIEWTLSQSVHRKRTSTNGYLHVQRCGTSGSMRACHAAARDRSRVGINFLGEVFSGFSLTCKTKVRRLWAHRVPEYPLAIIIMHHHFIMGANDLRCWRALKPKYTNIHTVFTCSITWPSFYKKTL